MFIEAVFVLRTILSREFIFFNPKIAPSHNDWVRGKIKCRTVILYAWIKQLAEKDQGSLRSQFFEVIFSILNTKFRLGLQDEVNQCAK